MVNWSTGKTGTKSKGET